jgi:hypothetical protein
MENKKPFEVNGKTYPANLKDLKEDKEAFSRYQIKSCYYLELVHGLMGFFPAIINGTKRMIVTTDKDLIVKIWEKLSPRKSKMNDDFFYVHEDGLVGYPAKHWTGDDSKSIACHLMAEEEFEILTNPFEWAPGLIGSDMSHEEFIKTIKVEDGKN